MCSNFIYEVKIWLKKEKNKKRQHKKIVMNLEENGETMKVWKADNT